MGIKTIIIGIELGALLISVFTIITIEQNAYAGTFPGTNGQIVFTSNRDETTEINGELYIMNADGSDPIRLTNSPKNDGNPSWSADGEKIVFRSERDGNEEIYVMNADGTGQTNITNNPAFDAHPSWSPDDTKIAFTSSRNSVSDIYVMNADGSNPIRLTNNSEGNEVPSWSPDGTKIAFASLRDGDHEIYIMNADGTGQTRLTNSIRADSSPSWSPDGTKIVFHSLRDIGFEIYVMNADGTGQTRLTNNSSIDFAPSWSPDGTKIVFTSYRDENVGEIYIMNADGTGQTNITNNLALDVFSAWQPIVDNILPTITLLGSTPITVELGSTYDDAGATASDDVDGDITSRVVTVNPVDINFSDTYTITYDVSDLSGNPAATVTRTVIVQDTTPPTITLNGDNPITLLEGEPYTEQGVTVTDNDPNYSGTVSIGGDTVDTNTVDTYTVTYDASSDAAGNVPVQVTRDVIIQADIDAPVINLNGNTTITLEIGVDTYTEQGATVTDNNSTYLEDVTIVYTDADDNIVDIDDISTSTGTYTVAYDAPADTSGNVPVQITRTIIMDDTTKPTITLEGDDFIVIILQIDTYTEQGATVTDNDPNYSGTVSIGGDTVNDNIVGTYAVVYTSDDADSSDLTPDPVNRTIHVVNTRIDLCESIDEDGNGIIDADEGKIIDADEDGICDAWERTGNLVIEHNGVTLSYPCGNVSETPGANCPSPEHKDIYVEIDYMAGHRPNDMALQKVIDVFRNASDNPLIEGDEINLHLYVDDAIPHQDTIVVTNNTSFEIETDFFELKREYFGTADERSGTLSDVTDILTAKKQVFHYAMFIHQQEGNLESSGLGEELGNDFVISLGHEYFAGGIGSPDQQAGTFMHELGHNLNLFHGGPSDGDDDIDDGDAIDDDRDNCKPNYLSVMNHIYQFPHTIPPVDWTLDYSQNELDLLNENNLNEADGFNSLNLDKWEKIAHNNNGIEPGYTADADGTSIDWNNANGSNEILNDVNIDFFGISECDGTDNTSFKELLSFEDWSHLDYNFKDHQRAFLTGMYIDDNAPGELTSGDSVFLRDAFDIPAPEPAPGFELPFANPQTVTTNKNTSLEIILTGGDHQGDSVTFFIDEQPEHGTLSEPVIVTNSTTASKTTYSPDQNFVGSDKFTFKANDGTHDGTEAAIVSIDVVSNDKPGKEDPTNILILVIMLIVITAIVIVMIIYVRTRNR